MAEPKTRPTDADVGAWLATLPAARRADCATLVTLMQRATGEAPVLWGTSIVGFGRCALPYANGSTQDWPVIGFSPRAKDLTVYLMDGTAHHAQALSRLGRHRTGKSCLYLPSLDGVDAAVLTDVIAASVRAMRVAHPVPGAGAAAKRASTAATGPTRKTASSRAPAAAKNVAARSARKSSRR